MDLQLRHALEQLLARGERVQAILEHRKRTGSTLREATGAVDALGIELKSLPSGPPTNSVSVPEGTTVLRNKRRFWQPALSEDESALSTIAQAASAAADAAVPTPHDFSAFFGVRAVQAVQDCEPRQALQAIYPELATSSIRFRSVSWSECKDRIHACLTLQPDVWPDAVHDPPREAAHALAQAALGLIEGWLDMNNADCFDCDHPAIPGYDVFWSFAFMVEDPERHRFLWLRGLASD